MNRVWAIAKNTFTEVIRMPAYSIVLGIALALLALAPAFTMFTMSESTKLVKEMGLATVQLAGLLIAALAASASVSREIESRTATTVLSKPVGRIEFVLGKFAGLMLALLVASFLLTVTLLLAGRHGTLDTVRDKYDMPVIVLGALALVLALMVAFIGNYFFGWHFGATAVWAGMPLFALAFFAICFVAPDWSAQAFGSRMDPQLVLGSLLVLFAIMVLTAIALAVSTRLKVVGTLVVCAAVLVVGLLSDYVFGSAAHTNILARIAYVIVPNFQHFWAGDAVISAMQIPVRYVLYALAYAALYSVAALLLALCLFQDRELA